VAEEETEGIVDFVNILVEIKTYNDVTLNLETLKFASRQVIHIYFPLGCLRQQTIIIINIHR